MASYLPQSGVNGLFIINNTSLAADTYEFFESANVMEAPSFTGGPWMEHAIGKKKGGCSFTGTWDASFNPFANQMKVGLRVAVGMYLNGIGGPTAIDLDAIIADWRVSDASDGKAEYNCSIVFDYTFTDFSGANA